MLLPTIPCSRSSATEQCDFVRGDQLCIINSTRTLSQTLRIAHTGSIVITADISAPSVYLYGVMLDMRSRISCANEVLLNFNSSIVLSGSASVTGANVSIRTAEMALQGTSFVSVSGLGSSAGTGAGADAGSGSDSSSGGGAGGGHGGDVRARASKRLPLLAFERLPTCARADLRAS